MSAKGYATTDVSLPHDFHLVDILAQSRYVIMGNFNMLTTNTACQFIDQDINEIILRYFQVVQMARACHS